MIIKTGVWMVIKCKLLLASICSESYIRVAYCQVDAKFPVYTIEPWQWIVVPTWNMDPD